MNEDTKLEGTCLCGAARITTGKAITEAGVCHCGMCRKWGGGPMMSAQCGTEVVLEGGDAIGVFDSSPWAERGFCRTCGTHLFYRIKQGQHYHLPIGLFGDAVAPQLTVQVFIDKKPDWYSLAQETKTLTEAEIFAMYAPKD